jgi:molybdopterin converting factor small subunit
MNIRVRLIGRYRTIAGQEFIQFDIKAGTTLRQVVDAFVKQYPLVDKDKKFMMVSKNGALTSLDTPIGEGDEITICPPVVSGG